jgi:hypothetical protein
MATNGVSPLMLLSWPPHRGERTSDAARHKWTATGGALTPHELPFTEFGSVRAEGDRAVFRAGAPDHPASIVALASVREHRRLMEKGVVLDLLDEKIRHVVHRYQARNLFR